MDRNKKQKLILTITMISMVIFSIVLAAIMAKNMRSDVSQERSALTTEFTKIKDQPFQYDQNHALSLYQRLCQDCHGDQGQGRGANPALNSANSSDATELTRVVLLGRGNMPAHYKLPHQDMAHVLSYVHRQFGQQSELITPIKIIDFKIDTLKNK